MAEVHFGTQPHSYKVSGLPEDTLAFLRVPSPILLFRLWGRLYVWLLGKKPVATISGGGGGAPLVQSSKNYLLLKN